MTFTNPKGLAAASLLAASLIDNTAHAQTLNESMLVDAGVFLGYTFGADSPFSWGARLSVASTFGEPFRVQTNCGTASYGTLPFVGGTTRLQLQGLARPKLVVAAQSGVLLGRAVQVGTEVGGATRFDASELVLHLGFDARAHLLNLLLDYQPSFGEGTIATGVRGPWLDRRRSETSCVVDGRPLHNEHEIAPLPGVSLLCDTEIKAHPAQQAWSKRLAAEYASVSTFLQRADQLQIAGAPARLVNRALRSAQEEHTHAILCGSVLGGLSGAATVVEGGPHLTRAPAQGEEALIRLAVESWLDGCLNEGWASACAAREAERGAHEGIRRVQHQIAKDEARHQELAFQIIEFTVKKGGEAVREALLQAHKSSLHDPDDTQDEAPEDFGCLGRSDRALVMEEVCAQAEKRLHAMLA
jgi:hypothetical protein